MRFKYKKLIFALTLGVLCIAFISFSMMEPSFFSSVGKNAKEKSTSAERKGEKGDSSGETHSSKKTDGEEQLTENKIYKDIEELIAAYLKARQEVDMKAIEEYVTDIRNIDEKKLLTRAEYVEDTRNIDCTILAGAEEGCYCVIVYYEYKFFGVDTLAPCLTGFYVTEDKDGRLRIYLDVLDKKTQEYINNLYAGKTVKKLKSTVEEKYAEAVQSDEKLREIYEELENKGDDEGK